MSRCSDTSDSFCMGGSFDYRHLPMCQWQCDFRRIEQTSRSKWQTRAKQIGISISDRHLHTRAEPSTTTHHAAGTREAAAEARPPFETGNGTAAGACDGNCPEPTAPPSVQRSCAPSVTAGPCSSSSKARARSACPAASARPSTYAAKRLSCGPGAERRDPTKTILHHSNTSTSYK